MMCSIVQEVIVMMWLLPGVISDSQPQISVTLRRYSYLSKLVTVQFSQTLYRRFHECLCQINEGKCSAQVNDLKAVTYVYKHEKLTKNEKTCKYYKCSYEYNYTSQEYSLVCELQLSGTCNNNRIRQNVNFNNATCSYSNCITFCWSYTNEEISSSNIITGCNNNTCNYFTTTKSTVSTARTTKSTVSTARTTKSTVSTARTTQSTLSTARTTKTTSTTRTETASLSLVSTTESNITGSTNASFSNNQTGNGVVPIIVGVTVAVVVMLCIAAVVIFVWRRKVGSPLKPSASCHVYVNYAVSPVTVKNDETRTVLEDSNHQIPNEYSSCSDEDTSHDYATINTISSEPTSGANKRSTPYETEFVYTKAEPLITGSNVNVYEGAATDSNPRKDTSKRLAENFHYLPIKNTLDETDDGTKSIYSFANVTDSNIAKLADDMANHNSIKDINNATPQQNTIFKRAYPSDTKVFDGRRTNEDCGQSYTDRESNSSEYEIIGPKIDAHLDRETYNDKDEHLDYQTYDLAATGEPSNDQNYLRFNTDEDYSTAGNLHYHDNSTDICKSPNVYAKLREEARNVKHPYNILLHENDAPIPKEAIAKPSKEARSTYQPEPYSMAQSVKD